MGNKSKIILTPELIKQIKGFAISEQSRILPRQFVDFLTELPNNGVLHIKAKSFDILDAESRTLQPDPACSGYCPGCGSLCYFDESDIIDANGLPYRCSCGTYVNWYTKEKK